MIKTKVLVLDDEYPIANKISLILENEGYQPYPVFSANIALETMKEHMPDIALLDIKLVGSDIKGFLIKN